MVRKGKPRRRRNRNHAGGGVNDSEKAMEGAIVEAERTMAEAWDILWTMTEAWDINEGFDGAGGYELEKGLENGKWFGGLEWYGGLEPKRSEPTRLESWEAGYGLRGCGFDGYELELEPMEGFTRNTLVGGAIAKVGWRTGGS